MNLLILGASGGCGQWIVRLAAARGHDVRAVVRPSSPYRPPAGVEVLRGDVYDASVLEEALAGRDAVLSALGLRRKSLFPWSPLLSTPDLTTTVAKHLVGLMPAAGVHRVVAISAGGVGDSRAHTHPLINWMIDHSNMGPAYADLNAMEATFAASDLDWMVVRPTTLSVGPPRLRTRQVTRYGLASMVRRSDVAAWMLDAVVSPPPFAMRTPLIGG